MVKEKKKKIKRYELQRKDGTKDILEIDQYSKNNITYRFNELGSWGNFDLDETDYIIDIKYHPKKNTITIYYDIDENHTLGSILKYFVKDAIINGVDFTNIPKIEYIPFNWDDYFSNKLSNEQIEKEQLEAKKYQEEYRISKIKIYGDSENPEKYEKIISDSKSLIFQYENKIKSVSKLVDKQEEEKKEEFKKNTIDKIIEKAKGNGLIIDKNKFDNYYVNLELEDEIKIFNTEDREERLNKFISKLMDILKKQNKIIIDSETLFNAFESILNIKKYEKELEFKEYISLYINETESKDLFKEFKIKVQGRDDLYLYQVGKLEIPLNYIEEIEKLKFREVNGIKSDLNNESTYLFLSKEDFLTLLRQYSKKESNSIIYNLQ